MSGPTIRLSSRTAQVHLPRRAGGRVFRRRPSSDGTSAIWTDEAQLTPAGLISGWSPSADGQHVIVATSPDGDRDHRLAVTDARGTTVPVVDLTTRRPSPVPSPDATGFWLVAERNERAAARPVFLPCHSRTGPSESRLRPTRSLDDPRLHGARRLAVGPDGHTLAVLTRAGGSDRVWLVRLSHPGTDTDDIRLIARTEAGGLTVLGFTPTGLPCVVSTVLHDGGDVLVASDSEATQWTIFQRSELRDTDRVVDVCWSRDAAREPVALLHAQRDGRSLLVGHRADGRPVGPTFTPGADPGTLLDMGPGAQPGEFDLVWSAPLVPPRELTCAVTGPKRRRPVTLPSPATGSPATGSPATRRPAAPKTRAEEFPASDGVRVPVLVSTPAGGPAGPTVLTCYGGFGLTLPPAYSAAVAAWVGAGGSWIAVGARGGSERGAAWHQAGRGRRKPRSVADLEEAADWALSTGLAATGQVGLYGSSHGGLVAAAAAARRPERYAAVAVTAPVVDVRGFHREPAGRPWLSELGDPDDPGDARALSRIDPLRIADGESGPALLVVLGLLDQRVAPRHGRSLVRAWTAWGERADGTRRCPLPRLDEHPDLGHVSRDDAESRRRAESELAFLATELMVPNEYRSNSNGRLLPISDAAVHTGCSSN